MKRSQRTAMQQEEETRQEINRCACGLAPIKARTQRQKEYLREISLRDIVFGLGPAGTGKTYLAVSAACEAFVSGKAKRIVITRPAVEAAGEHLGFLPGELGDKFAPYFRPVLDVLHERLGRAQVESACKYGKIEAIPLAYMRGMTFHDAWVILDEAQNTTPEQMRMFLTRLGDNTKGLINGDLDQSDIEDVSGLQDGWETIMDLPRVGAVTFTEQDVVRSGICLDIVQAYYRRNK